MKLFHLSTLPAVPLGMHGEGRALVLPALVPEPHVEPILGWWGRSLRAGLPRIDVDWDTGLSPASVRLLGRARDSFGRDGVLVVVRLKVEENDLDAVAGAPALASFEHVALVTRHRARQVRLRQLSQACAAVVRALGDEWRTRAPELGLRVEAFDEIRDSLAGLLDPAEVVEAVNDLAEVGLAGLRPDAQVATVRRRVVTRQLAALSPDLLVALIAMATGHSTEVSPADRDELAERDLVVGGALRGWAAWVPDPQITEGLFGERGPVPHASQRLEGWGDRLDESARRMRMFCRGPMPPWSDPELEAVSALVTAGALEDARVALDRLGVGLDTRAPAWRSDYLYVVGEIRRAEGDLPRAEAAFHDAITLAHEADAPLYEATCHSSLGRLLRDSGRWAEAEPHLRKAIELQVEGGATTLARGAAYHELGVGLREFGDWSTAEAAFREALRLGADAKEGAGSRAITLFELGIGLQVNGRWTDAESALREALHLEESAGASQQDLATTLAALASVLEHLNKHREARTLRKRAAPLRPWRRVSAAGR